jgi:hypothetical protein
MLDYLDSQGILFLHQHPSIIIITTTTTIIIFIIINLYTYRPISTLFNSLKSGMYRMDGCQGLASKRVGIPHFVMLNYL